MDSYVSLLKKKGVPPQATVRELKVKCGRCPEEHGPYAYAEWKVEGKTLTKYLGRVGQAQRKK